ncbi:MAG TPA: methyltransferase domain-containing protein [Chthoniobacterales bacterium]|nr:methyltransferase domain-containing protein [Chthoniobacterales bacterium]
MSKREFSGAEPELMDRPGASSAELEAALRSLRGLNRYFGSYRVVSQFMNRWIRRGDHVRVVDLATGSADIPRLVAEHARAVGAKAEIVAVDFQPATIDTARRLNADYPEIVCECADVLAFQPREKFDIAICSLALHHFSADDAIRLLRHCRDLSRRFVLVSDLRRGLLLRVGVNLLTAVIFRDRMTFHDGRTSARRAFSFRELRELAERAGWEKFGSGRFRFARQAIWLE